MSLCILQCILLRLYIPVVFTDSDFQLVMPPKKSSKNQAAQAPSSSKKHPGPVKGLAELPTGVLKNIVDRLNYPTLQILRGTCKLFRDFKAEKEIYAVFMDLKLDHHGASYEEIADDFEVGMCACKNFATKDTSGYEHAPGAKGNCKACKNREYALQIRRPGANIAVDEIDVEFYEYCKSTDEGLGGALGICRKC
jgi:hypothetical protein